MTSDPGAYVPMRRTVRPRAASETVVTQADTQGSLSDEAIEAGYDEPLVRALLVDQHPDLAGRPPARVAGGWDNQLWRLGDDLAVRLPRTARADALLLREHRWVPALAPSLPLPVAVPLRLGVPSARFPRPWTIAAWVPGTPADQAPAAAPSSAEVLGGFLRALHSPAPDGAPVNPGRSGGLAEYSQGIHSNFQAAGFGSLSPEIRGVWDAAISAPQWNGPPVWVHADLHPANVVTSGGALAGVVDFGEISAGDPAVDLAAAWLLLPSGSVSRCFAAYAAAGQGAGEPSAPGGEPVLDRDLVRRARGFALRASSALLAVGRAGERGEPGGKISWGAAGRIALERILAEG